MSTAIAEYLHRVIMPMVIKSFLAHQVIEVDKIRKNRNFA